MLLWLAGEILQERTVLGVREPGDVAG